MRTSAKRAIAAAAAAAVLFAGFALGGAADQPAVDAEAAASAEVWSKALERYPRALPPDARLPREAPFILTADDTVGVYESGLVEAIAADLWRCSWLEFGLESRRSARAADNRVAETQLARDRGLPVPVGFDEDAAARALLVEAERRAQHPWQVEFEARCGEWFTGEESSR